MKVNPQHMEVGLLIVANMRNDNNFPVTRPVEVAATENLGRLACEYAPYGEWIETDLAGRICSVPVEPQYAAFEAALESLFADIEGSVV
jgi:hypothetical protein